MRNNPKPYEIYEHFKGNRYQIIALAQHSETEEDMVVYQALYGEYKMYVRPLFQFMGMVDEKKYPEKKGQYRFQKITGEMPEEKEMQQTAEADSEENALEAVDRTSEEEALEAVDRASEEEALEAVSRTSEEETSEAVNQADRKLTSENIRWQGGEKSSEASGTEGGENGDEVTIDPMVMDFLDAHTYEERLNILAALHHRITDDMINTMAISVDVEIEDGPIETRYEELKHCIITFQKYQCSRMR